MEIDDLVSDFEDRAADFSNCLSYMAKEENSDDKTEITSYCLPLLHVMLRKIRKLLSALRERIVWSMTDDRHDHVRKVAHKLQDDIKRYQDYATQPEHNNTAAALLPMLDEAIRGFRLSCAGCDFFAELFNRTLEQYRAKHSENLEIVYDLDFQDRLQLTPDTRWCRYKLLEERRTDLFTHSHFGSVFHDLARNPAQLAAHIVDQHEPDATRIDEFMHLYVAFEIAQGHCLAEADTETEVRNIVFKDNVDTARVMRRLEELVADGTISTQKHWYVAWRVFLKKDWLGKKAQTDFIEQINETFHNTLKCTDKDFKKVDSYFKDTKDFADWKPSSPLAPRCCKKYRTIADKLDREFQEEKYAKPGTLINTKYAQNR